MQLNKLKCGILLLGSKTAFIKFEIINRQIEGIPFVLQYKYLGISFDKMLSTAPHLNHLEDKLKNFKKMALILRL